MKMTQKKPIYGLTREQERQASRLFGRHVGPAKALVCVLVSALVCLTPMLAGLRLWEQIPALVETGLIGPEGKDDSLPRAVLVFGVPGLFCLLDLVCHVQLWLHQKAGKLPPTPIRLLGRWGIPLLAVPLGGFWILRAAGETTGASLFLPCVLALLLLLLGAHFFDCGRESRLAFHLKSIEYKEKAWRITHRAAGLAWMAAGLLLLALLFGMGRLPWFSAVLTVLLLLSPFAAARWTAKHAQ